jgi:hypothetical protein
MREGALSNPFNFFGCWALKVRPFGIQACNTLQSDSTRLAILKQSHLGIPPIQIGAIFIFDESFNGLNEC